jgi:hypothetical protein
LKRTNLVVCVVFAALFCHAQTTQSQTSGQNQTTPAVQQPADNSQDATSPKPQAGQSGNPADQKQDKPSQTAKDAAKGASDTPGTSKDRLFFALPNFLTVENAGNVPPLTTGEKYKVVARGSFDPIQIVWYAALSGISQAENSEPGYGQGAEGYGKRYGAYAADGTIENFFVGAIFPSMLHQDPRFFPKIQGTFVNRSEYAVSRIFVTRTDSGKSQFNYSEIVGSAVAAAISNYSYHPHPGYHPIAGESVPYVASDRTFTNTLSVWGTQVGYDAITLVVKEFWPDIRRKLKKQPRVLAIE